MTHNMKRWTITAMIMTVMLVASIGISSAAYTYGTQTGSFTLNGVTVIAKSNGGGTHYEPIGPYGLQYECVEYVNRFYGEALHHYSMYTHSAKNYYSTASSYGLNAYPNSGTEKPKIGDILCSNYGTYGHVAIVRAVTSSSVTVIEQNFLSTNYDNQHVISMSSSGGIYKVNSFNKDGKYPVYGWLRKPVTLTVSPSSGRQGMAFTFSGNGYVPNGVVEYHVKKPNNIEFPVTTLTASGSGAITYRYPSTTASMTGTYTIWAVDKSTGRQSKNVPETITR